MNGLTDLVRESLTHLTDSAALPAGLGDRAVAAGTRRRRRHKVLVGATALVAVAAVVVPVAVLAQGGVTQLAATAPENAVFAVRHTEYLATSDAESDIHRWEVLDPKTGDYRDVFVKTVSEPSTDLRYAAVIPKGDGAHVPRRIGRYETTTGDLRWYDVPVRPNEVTISPDGRHAAAVEWGIIAKVAIVDLSAGTTARFDIEEEAGAATDVPDPAATPPPPANFDTLALGWAPDSRHLIWGQSILDLAGNRTGQLAVPDEARIVSVDPGGAGTLVHFYRTPAGYAVLDGSGAMGPRVTIDIPCTTSPPLENGCSQGVWPAFLSWRGADQILVQTGRGPDAGYEAVDLRTGDHEPVSPPRVDGEGITGDLMSMVMVIISADRLSPSTRERVAF